MRINNRLKQIANYITDNSNVLDVGCDHALLDIYLVLNKKNIKCIASDINEGPLLKAKENIDKFKLNKLISIRKEDGIGNIKNIDTVVISGLGGTTIIDIIKKDLDNLNEVKQLVLSPNNDFYLLRKELTNLGYIIDKEEYFYDKEKYYLIISLIKGNKSYSKKQLIYGTNLNNKDYFKYLLENEIIKLNKMPKKYIIKRLKINKKIKELNKIII